MIFVMIAGVLLFSILAYRLKALTRGGAAAALCIGILIALGFELAGLFILGLFFVTSTMWSKWKRNGEDEINEKGGQRDGGQVLANGGTAAFFALLYLFVPSTLWVYGFAGALAAAASDTWASEIGGKAKGKPIHIKTRKKVPKGTSGAVSPQGTLASLLGSAMIGITTAFLFPGEGPYWMMVVIIATAGFFGNIIDTLAGALIQVEYKCAACGLRTERTHHCNGRTVQVKGWRSMNNETVNFLCTIFGAVSSAALFYLFTG
ncbi:DUF92 domain-containing protein [Thalassorhabdus alkalitolerans]|uniref:DUF92 domain-containing protein n=1 Tax=Thalassorhabdus alkalitolerans TaxID=2282697 RepID=A0ABW0YLW3_9BACI